jgi:hypothetical protein
MHRKSATVLLDTAEWSDAISTGRTRAEDLDRGETGLRVTYECDAVPVLTVFGVDGEVQFIGAAEIFWVLQSFKWAAAWACRDEKAAK